MINEEIVLQVKTMLDEGAQECMYHGQKILDEVVNDNNITKKSFRMSNMLILTQEEILEIQKKSRGNKINN